MPNVLPLTTRMRLEVQGFGHVHDDLLIEIGPWLRLPFIVYAFFAIAGTVTLSAWTFWAMVPLAAAGAAFGVHPADAVYNRWLRRTTRTRPLPPRAAPSRFAHGMFGAGFLVAGFAFAEAIETAGYAAGTGLAVLALLVSVADICVLSMIYRGIFGYHGRTRSRRAGSGEAPVTRSAEERAALSVAPRR